MKLTGSRVYWISSAAAAAFVLYGLFFYISQQNLLKNITTARLTSAQVQAEDQAKAETARLRGHAVSMASTVAKLAASQLENSQTFNVTKDGMASTLEPFMDYREISAIEITDKDCVFRPNVTDRFGIVTGDFGNVTEDFGNVTGRNDRQVWRCA